MSSLYAERRRRVLEMIGDGILLQFAAPQALRNNDVEYEYRQDSDLYYLTGLDEPESVLALSGGDTPSFALFVRPRDSDRETWDGERIGVEGAIERFSADTAHPIGELETQLMELFKGRSRLLYAIGRHQKNDQLVLGVLQRLRERARRGESCPTQIVEPSTVLHELRLVKSDAEIELMRRAVAITREAHHALLAQTRPGMTEYELEAILRGQFRRQGSERCAYAPIVASGRNGRVLHYHRNDRELCDQDLVLVDAAAEYGYMASDVTRTFPANGRFTALQRQAYEIVLRAQQRAIDAVTPGTTLDDVHQAAVRELCQGLIELGVLAGSVESVLESEGYKKYYMHRTSHWLGMDVHDVGAYFRDGKPRPLEVGMVLTVEPGLYFSREDPSVPDGLKDVGIRIEDDVLVTVSGSENLSATIARRVEDIEAMMSVQPRVQLPP
jgi:Xaa-Pro aminopeptidase